MVLRVPANMGFAREKRSRPRYKPRSRGTPGPTRAHASPARVLSDQDEPVALGERNDLAVGTHERAEITEDMPAYIGRNRDRKSLPHHEVAAAPDPGRGAEGLLKRPDAHPGYRLLHRLVDASGSQRVVRAA